MKEEIKLTRSYLGGMTFEDHATREYEYEITNTKLKGTRIRNSVYTPRIDEFTWGVQENKFWIVGKEKVFYKNNKELKEALDSL